MKTHFKTSKLCLAALTAMTLAFGNGGVYSASYANPSSQDPISCSDPKTQFPTLPPCHRSNDLAVSGSSYVVVGQMPSNHIQSASARLNDYFGVRGGGVQ